MKFFLIPIFVVTSLFFSTPHQVHAQALTAERRQELQRQLESLEAEIKKQEQVVATEQGKRVSLERDVSILTAQINRAKLSIQARDLAIRKLAADIDDKEDDIKGLDAKLIREQASFSETVRRMHELDGLTLPEIILSGKKFSKAYEDAGDFVSLHKALAESGEKIKVTRKDTEEAKKSLEEKQEEQIGLRKVQELERQKSVAAQKEKDALLKETKGREAVYQKILAEKTRSAAQIRAELFKLRDSGAISFERAYELALQASRQTGVRPAFLLGILRVESNLGQNVGTGNWKVDMPPRDHAEFIAITSALGRDPDKTPVSKKPWYGWGGAMGPAQFIPITWVLFGGYEKISSTPETWRYSAEKDKVRNLLGKDSPSDPWDPADAIMAMALLSKENGAAAGTRSAERLAALRYLAGWANASKPQFAFYGNDVMEYADQYQKQIDIIK